MLLGVSDSSPGFTATPAMITPREDIPADGVLGEFSDEQYLPPEMQSDVSDGGSLRRNAQQCDESQLEQDIPFREPSVIFPSPQRAALNEESSFPVSLPNQIEDGENQQFTAGMVSNGNSDFEGSLANGGRPAVPAVPPRPPRGSQPQTPCIRPWPLNSGSEFSCPAVDPQLSRQNAFKALTNCAAVDPAVAHARMNPKTYPYKKGEIFFSENHRVAKFLVVPEQEQDPLMVLEKMLNQSSDGWQIPLPSMTISVENSPGDFTKKPRCLRDDEHETDATWCSKVDGMMTGVCQAAGRCGAWIVSEMALRGGGQSTGSAADRGMVKLREIEPNMEKHVVNIALCDVDTLTGNIFGQMKDADRELVESFTSVFCTGPFDEFVNRYCVEMGSEVGSRWVYPSPPAGLEIPQYLSDPRLVEAWGDLWLGILRPEITHLVIAGRGILRKLKFLTETMWPHARIIIGGPPVDKKPVDAGIETCFPRGFFCTDDGSFSTAKDVTLRGGHIILLRQSGGWIDKIVGILDNEDPDRLHSEKQIIRNMYLTLDPFDNLPELIKTRIAEVLEKKGVYGAGMQQRQKFMMEEKRRIDEAWTLVAVYQHNGRKQKYLAQTLYYSNIGVFLLAIFAAVLWTSSQTDKMFGVLSTTKVNDFLSPAIMSVLEIMCVILPFIASFIIAMDSKFNPMKQSAVLYIAASRLRMAIYMYRAKVCQYSPGRDCEFGFGRTTKCIRNDQRAQQHSGRFEAENTSREAFSNNIRRIQNEVALECKSSGLKPPNISEYDKIRNSWQTSSDAETAHQFVVLIGKDHTGVREDSVHDDGCSFLTAASYFQVRTLPMIQRWSALSKPMEGKWTRPQFVIPLCTSLAAVFSIAGMQAWIPLVIAAILAIDASVRFEQYFARLNGLTNSLTQLKTCQTWWNQLDGIQKCMLANKARLVQMTENAISEEIKSWTLGLSTASHADANAESHEGGSMSFLH